MKQKRVRGVDMRQLRLEAGAVLSEHANRLTLMLAVMVAVSPLMLCLSATSLFRLAVVPLFSEMEWLGYGLMILLILTVLLLLVFPLGTGLWRLASEMEAGREPDLADIFYAFSQKDAYRTALRVSYSALWRLSILVALEWGLYGLLFTASRGAVWMLLLGIPLYVGVFLLWAWLSMRSFLLPYFAMILPDAAVRMRPYARSVGAYYWIGFFPWIVLSLLTVGILLLADLLPRMLIAYFRLCRKLNELTTQSEELINE